MENFNLYQITSSFPVLMENEEITDKVITGLAIKNQNNKRVFLYTNKKGE